MDNTKEFFLKEMRMVGLEPTRDCSRKILSLVRLPFRHIRLYFSVTKFIIRGISGDVNEILCVIRSFLAFFIMFQEENIQKNA